MKKIILVLHGFDCKKDWYIPVMRVIKECFPGNEVLFPELPLNRWSATDPDSIVDYLLGLLDIEWNKFANSGLPEKEMPGIILVGHSTGSLLARKLYVAACGENENVPIRNEFIREAPLKPWAAKVERIILFAGLNRGWTLNAHLYTKTAFLMRLGLVAGAVMALFNRVPLPFKTRRGSPFITQLRIQWLSMLREVKRKNAGSATVIQLLGTKDDLISPEDNIDMLTGNQFIYLEVPASDHINVLNMNDSKCGKKRTEIFKDALSKPKEELQKMQVLPEDPNILKVDETVTDVVFVIHGIRDTGYWTQKIARRVKAIGDKETGRKFATETSTYGYFAMLPFLLPFQRSKKVKWLMDQYTENLAIYPNAEFSFVGHSNGTYLLAKALKDYPACRFRHVIFAGSVVHKNYNWNELIEKGRVKKIFNLVASDDWVVAMFPKSLQTLRLADLGSGGFDGFSVNLNEPYQLRFVKGAHGAAIEEKYWNEIASFIVNGHFSEFDHLAVPERSVFMRILGRSAPIPFLILLAIVFYGGCVIYNSCENIYAGVLLVFIYVFILMKMVTRF